MFVLSEESRFTKSTGSNEDNIEEEIEEYILTINGRTKLNICRLCGTRSWLYIPREINGNISCEICLHKIITKVRKRINESKKKCAYKIIFQKILEDIIEVGYHPDRIYQTIHFDIDLWKRFK